MACISPGWASVVRAVLLPALGVPDRDRDAERPVLGWLQRGAQKADTRSAGVRRSLGEDMHVGGGLGGRRAEEKVMNDRRLAAPSWRVWLACRTSPNVDKLPCCGQWSPAKLAPPRRSEGSAERGRGRRNPAGPAGPGEREEEKAMNERRVAAPIARS